MAYFPNGTSGEFLDRQCDQCPLASDAPCPVLLVQLEYNYDQCGKGQKKLRAAMNLLIDEEGHCKMKPCIDAAVEIATDGEKPDPARPIQPMTAMRDWAKEKGLPVA